MHKAILVFEHKSETCQTVTFDQGELMLPILSVPILSVLYDEPDPATYRGVKLVVGDWSTVFNTSEPTVDFLAARVLVHLREKTWGTLPIMRSSSIDHFVMDGGELNDDAYNEDEYQRAHELAKARYEEG